MIPTSYKAKLPGFLSYPVGAELISEELADVPQYDKLELHFSDYNAVKNTASIEVPIPILDIRLSFLPITLSTPNYRIEQGAHEEHWEISIRPVPVGKKSLVRELLRAEGFAHIRTWLCAKRTETWKQGRRTFKVYFDLPHSRFLYDEPSS